MICQPCEFIFAIFRADEDALREQKKKKMLKKKQRAKVRSPIVLSQCQIASFNSCCGLNLFLVHLQCTCIKTAVVKLTLLAKKDTLQGRCDWLVTTKFHFFVLTKMRALWNFIQMSCSLQFQSYSFFLHDNKSLLLAEKIHVLPVLQSHYLIES